MKTAYEVSLEQATGKTMEYMRNTPLDEQRRETEKKQGKVMQYASYYPLIGRGSVLRSRAVSHEYVEKIFNEAVKQ